MSGMDMFLALRMLLADADARETRFWSWSLNKANEKIATSVDDQKRNFIETKGGFRTYLSGVRERIQKRAGNARRDAEAAG
ncbi:hypothetical protein F5X68DRAFT_214099 [Plectosphaerella plurivora]|uniref:Uncharacterized protein n=1 Tax=Plectosphaerella plurivora TaxID=936078 RepID=A0A9P9A8D7_9PEZI|nr:hypothetical protein F5X68DRAFT_214099 [Plectosphaerella plurivora]